MKVMILAVGKVKGPVAAAVSDYEERAGRYWKMEVAEVPSGPGKGGSPDDEAAVREAEGERLLARVPDDLETVALTRGGRAHSSRELARYLGNLGLEAREGVAFLLGGAFGLPGTVLRRCDERFSLSSYTLPHELARLVLTEQIYRAGTILRREPYHKEGGRG